MSIVLVVALSMLGVFLFSLGQDSAKNAQNSLSSIQTELSRSAFLIYENTTVSGSQVVNALRKFESTDEFGIRVITGKNPTGTWYINTLDITTPESATYGSVATAGGSQFSNVIDESHPDYINPSGKFKGTLVEDKNGVIRGIIFVQN